MPGRIEIRISIMPAWSEQDELLDQVRLAEDAGLGLAGVQEHPCQ